MKKLFCLLLAFALLLPAAFAAAEETAVTTPEEAPGIYFGADPDTAYKYFEKYWNGCS